MKRILINEEEKKQILSLYGNINKYKSNFINESKVDVTDIQNILVQKLGKDVLGPNQVDGKLGQYTINAIYSALTQNLSQLNKDNNSEPQNNIKNFIPNVGSTANGNYQDNAQGMKFEVAKVNNKNCDVVEVVLKQKLKDRVIELYTYYKPSEQNEPQNQRKEINLKRNGENQKSENPCNEFKNFETYATLTFQ